MGVTFTPGEFLISQPLRLGVVPLQIRFLVGWSRKVDGEEGPIERAEPTDIQRAVVKCGEAAREQLKGVGKRSVNFLFQPVGSANSLIAVGGIGSASDG